MNEKSTNTSNCGDAEEFPSQRQIVAGCQENDKQSIDAFFRLNLPYMKRVIRQTFLNKNFVRYAWDLDVVADIIELAVKELFVKKSILKCNNVDDPRSWLAKIVENKVFDWLRTGRTRKKQLEKSVNDPALVLSENFSSEIADSFHGNFTSEEDSADIYTAVQKIKSEIAITVQAGKGSLDVSSAEVVGTWVLRLSIIKNLPLTHNELVMLSHFNGMSMQQLQNAIDEIMLVIEKRALQRARDKAAAIILWHRIMQLEARYNYLNSSNQYDKKVGLLIDEIEKKRAVRLKLLQRSEKEIKPPSINIAQIVGITSNQAVQITKILEKMRSKLRNKLL